MASSSIDRIPRSGKDLAVSTPPPIEGVTTNTAGFVGQTVRGPTEPRLMTSWANFQRWYGGLGRPEASSYLPPAVRGFFDNGGTYAYIARVTPSAARHSTLELSIGDGKVLVLSALGPGDLNGRLFAWLERSPRNGFLWRLRRRANRFRLVVVYYDTPPETGPEGSPLVDPLEPGGRGAAPVIVEEFESLVLDSHGQPLELESALVTATIGPAPSGTRPLRSTVKSGERVYVPASGGDDGVGDAGDLAAAIALADFVGETPSSGRAGSGLVALEGVDAISLLTVPDEGHAGVDAAVRAGITNAVVRQCEQRRDRFGILQFTVSEGADDPAGMRHTVSTSYAAVYFPWLRVLDEARGKTLLVPPGGHVAGVIARSDTENGVHKAPANLEMRGIVTDLPERDPLSVIVSDRVQDVLNTRGINVIRDFRDAGRGVRVWGARTLADDPEWKYVSVRRLFIFLERSISEGTRWAVFEPNAEPTWARVRQSVTNFLTGVWRAGGLAGTKQEEAFFVRCDRTTMSLSDIEAGRLVCEVGIAPTRPREFVIFRIGQWTNDAHD